MRYSEKYKETCIAVMDEIRAALEGVSPEETERLVEAILEADTVFVVGVGRVLLSLQAFSKRLVQMGIKSYFVGDIVEPAITSSDLLIVGSGSGMSLFPVAIARKAKSFHAKVIHIGSNPNSDMKGLADFMVRIPVRTKLYLEDEIPSQQPMTTLFEQALLIFTDILAKMIIDEKNIDMKSLWKYHANLE